MTKGRANMKFYFIFTLLTLSYFIGLVKTSENGLFYECDAAKLTSNNECIFKATSQAPSSWGGKVSENEVDRSVGNDHYRKIVDIANKDLTPTPKPWVNGDKLVKSTTKLTGTNWNYVLIYELIAPLRNALMFHPTSQLKNNETNWKLLTKALVDCHIKEEDVSKTYPDGRKNTAYSVTSVYKFLKDVNANGGANTKNYFLQFLEESALDLDCLVTDISQERCDTMRKLFDINTGTYCDCWMDAYKQLYGTAPTVDSTFKKCIKSNNTSPATRIGASGLHIPLTAGVFSTFILLNIIITTLLNVFV